MIFSQDIQDLKNAKIFTTSANAEIRWNYANIRKAGISSYTKHHIARSVIDCFTQNVVGNGLTLQHTPRQSMLGMSDSQYKQVTDEIEDRFLLWQEKNNFLDTQVMAYKESKIAGDSLVWFSVKNKQLVAKALDSSVINTTHRKGEFHGVVLDANGEHKGLRIIGSNAVVPHYRTGTAGLNYILYFNKERPRQLRGLSCLAQSYNILESFNSFLNSETKAAELSSAFIAYIQSELPVNQVLSGIRDTTKSALGKATDDKSLDVSPNAVVGLKAGESMHFYEHNRPNTGLKDYTNVIIQLVAQSVGLPMELIAREFKASYSASQSAILLAKHVFDMERQAFVKDVCKKVFREWLRIEVLSGRVDLPRYLTDSEYAQAFSHCQFIGKSVGLLDSVKQANAYKTKLENKMVLPSEVIRDSSNFAGDFSDFAQRYKQETKMLEDTTGGTDEE